MAAKTQDGMPYDVGDTVWWSVWDLANVKPYVVVGFRRRWMADDVPVLMGAGAAHQAVYSSRIAALRAARAGAAAELARLDAEIAKEVGQ